MKKIFTLFAALAMVMSMSAAKLYLTPNDNWNADNARFAAYFFGNGEKWISMTKVAGETNLYEVEAPAGYPNVIFCRMNPNAAANNWDNKWNQTGDLTIPKDGKNHYTVKEGTWDKGGGEWTIWPIPTAKNYVDVTITVTANAAASIKWHSAGDKLADATDYVAMNAGENNTYTYTLAQVDDFSGVKYTIKVGDVVSEEQTTSTNVTADFKTLMKQAFLKGSMNDWGDKGKMTIADDYLTASIVLSLNAGSYEWKMYVGVDWLGGGKTVTRENNTHKLTDGDNCNLTADIKGNYTFTWTYATNTLTVTYPAVKYTVNLSDNTGGLEPLTSGVGEYEDGTEVTVSAVDGEGWVFVGWMDENGDIVSNDYHYTFVIEGNVELVAIYAQLMELEVNDLEIITEPVVSLTGTAELMPGMTLSFELIVDASEQGDGGEFYLTEDSKVYLNDETELEFQEGIALIEMMSNTAQAQVLAAMGETLYLFKLDMSAAAEPTNVLVTNAVKSYDEGSGALKLTGLWEGVEVFVEIGGCDGKESIEYSTPQGVLFETPDVVAFGNEASIIVAGEDITVVCNGLKPMMGNDVYNVTITTLSEVSTALDNLSTTVAPVKMIENGQLIIINNGVQYNAQGAVIK